MISHYFLHFLGFPPSYIYRQVSNVDCVGVRRKVDGMWTMEQKFTSNPHISTHFALKNPPTHSYSTVFSAKWLVLATPGENNQEINFGVGVNGVWWKLNFPDSKEQFNPPHKKRLNSGLAFSSHPPSACALLLIVFYHARASFERSPQILRNGWYRLNRANCWT